MLLQVIVVFSYVWGRAQFPSAARLVIAIDTFFSFFAAWALTVSLRRWRPFVAVLIAAAVLAIHVPIASQHRMMNRLTQTRETATAWRFFESLHEKRILIVTDRPDLFTIMEYGAMSFEAPGRTPSSSMPSRDTFSTTSTWCSRSGCRRRARCPATTSGRSRRLETMLEYQNDADVLVRISRLGR